LKSEVLTKEIARHTSSDFFENLLNQSIRKLNSNGCLVMILPIETSILIENLVKTDANLHLNEIINIHSFDDSKPHRKILKIGLNPTELNLNKFVIYEAQGIYSSEYQNLLKDFFTIF
jgi:tRNA1Val (adenine37-N6)-methyltransferase